MENWFVLKALLTVVFYVLCDGELVCFALIVGGKEYVFLFGFVGRMVLMTQNPFLSLLVFYINRINLCLEFCFAINQCLQSHFELCPLS